MKNDYVTVLDFGSGKITAMAAICMREGDFVIKAVGQSAYGGFDEEGWYEPDKLTDAVRSAITQIEDKADYRVKDVIVGVPGNFCAVATSEATIAFRSRKKLDETDVRDVIAKANIYDESELGVLISDNPVYFLLDGGIPMYSPVGEIAQRLTGLVCFSFMKTVFYEAVSETLENLGISRVEYVNVCEKQALYVGSQYAINGYAVVIDVGHITTNVMLTGGKSLLYAKTFALGSGYAAGDLSQVLNLDYPLCQALLSKINLKLECKEGDGVNVNGVAIDIYKANETVKARIEQIADWIIRCFDYCDKPIPLETPVILTGGGITYIKGGAEWLAYYLDKQLQVYTSVNPQTRRNEYTSCYGLLSYACSKRNSGGLFRKNRGGK